MMTVWYVEKSTRFCWCKSYCRA